MTTSPGDLIGLAMRRFRSRWVESLLIIMAIALGVSVLTAVIAIQDVSRRTEASFRTSLEARQVVIRSSANDFNAFHPPGVEPLDIRLLGSIYSPTVQFTFGDIQAIKAAAPSVDYGYARGRKAFQSDAWDGVLAATSVSADYLTAARIRVTSGSPPSVTDFESERNVMLVTPRFAAALELEGQLVGQEVEFVGEDAPFIIVGLLPDTPEQPISLREALIPFRAGAEPVNELWFAVEDPEKLPAAVSELEAFADSRWDGAVTVTTARDQSMAFLAQQRSRGLLIAFFAATALAVAAFNIMGLMLARVARRERDIGVGRSLGATRSAVSVDVLLEAASLGVLGSTVGVAAGYFLLGAYNGYLISTPGNFSVQIPFSTTAALSGAVLAVVLSVLAGFYPAILAARVRIVDALRGS